MSRIITCRICGEEKELEGRKLCHRCYHREYYHNFQPHAPRKRHVDEHFFENINTEEKAYWLGFIAADGCIRNKYTVAILLAARDKKHLEKFRDALKSNHLIRITINDGSGFAKKGSQAARIAIHSKKIVQHLNMLGITPRKSLTIAPSPVPVHLEHHYWRGIVNGDGWVIRRKAGSYVIGLCGTKKITEGFRDFLSSQGINSKSKIRSPRPPLCRIEYTGKSMPQKVASILYANASISLDRKRKTADELLSRSFITV